MENQQTKSELRKHLTVLALVYLFASFTLWVLSWGFYPMEWTIMDAIIAIPYACGIYAAVLFDESLKQK